MSAAPLNQEQLAQYQERGYVLARGLFDAEEIALLRRAAAEDLGDSPGTTDEDAMPGMTDDPDTTADEADGSGPLASSLENTRITDWNHPGDGIYGMVARCERMVNSIELLLGGEAYHYHSRMVMKDPRIGGAWPWHQDYAWWYYYGVLQPLLASAFIAVDPATRDNGCLQLIEGSHYCGRLDHVMVGKRIGADDERVQELLKRKPLVQVEMDPGDVLFFHCNLLHCSGRNASERPRWSLICVYNAARNDPYCESRHPRYTPLGKVPDCAVKEVGHQRFAGMF